MATEVQTAGAVPSVEARVSEEELARQRRWVMGIVNVSHGFNHMNSGVIPFLYPAMMVSLGFGVDAIAVLSAAQNIFGQGMQALYGFIAVFAKRAVILGSGNIVLGVATMVLGGVTTFPQMLVVKTIMGMGSSPQHPVGSTMLSTWFENARGKALGLHNTAGSIGTFIAPFVAGALILFMDWRLVVVILGIPSIILGLSYFALRDVVRAAPTGGRRALAKAGWGSYLACLKNRDLMLVCLLMMVGAAGRGGGLEQVYLIPYFVNDLHIPIAIAPTEGGLGLVVFALAFLTATATGFITIYNIGGLVAPITWGWISDHFPRKLVMQISLLLSAIATFWLGQVTELGVLLVSVIAFYGLVVHSRQAITQAMVGDYAGAELEDAAFSLYFTIGFLSAPIWTIIVGVTMQHFSFEVATQIKALSYIAGMLLLIPLRVNRPLQVA